MPNTPQVKKRQLKIEADFTGDDALAQLLAALRRIEDGLGNITTMVVAIDERTKAKADGR